MNVLRAGHCLHVKCATLLLESTIHVLEDPSLKETCMFFGKMASTPCESCWYFSIQLIFIIRRTPIQCDGTHSII